MSNSDEQPRCLKVALTGTYNSFNKGDAAMQLAMSSAPQPGPINGGF